MIFGFVFDSIGGGEWLVLLAVVLIVVGPRNLPSAARKLGNVMSTLRRAADEFKRQIMSMDSEIRKTVDEYVDIPKETGPDAYMRPGDPTEEGGEGFGGDGGDDGTGGYAAYEPMEPHEGGHPSDTDGGYVPPEPDPAPPNPASAPAEPAPDSETNPPEPK